MRRLAFCKNAAAYSPQHASSEIQHSSGSQRVVRGSSYGDAEAVAVAVAVAVEVRLAVVVSSGVLLGRVSFSVVVGCALSEVVAPVGRSVCSGEGGAVVVLGK